ncbi:MAG TPA: PIG-L deacetylase family protein [Planctomycetota bacterium]|jgi:LmbE family N-acetylglucosaminyl deacetylase|nr:PIG-L deacetylase family protein [Planctomycetota bacterium]
MTPHCFPPLLDKSALPARVLVFAPHPDDEVLGCGGMIAWHRRRGDALKVLQATDGAGGDPKGKFGNVAALRRAEIAEALAVLGVREHESLDLPDGTLAEVPDLAERLRVRLEAFRPLLVYAPSPLEAHADHRALAGAVCAALRGRSPLRVHWFGVNSPVVANVLYDVTETMPAKLEAAAKFRSQIAYNDLVGKVTAVNRAATVNVDLPEVLYVEPYTALPSGALEEVAGRIAALERSIAEAGAP